MASVCVRGAPSPPAPLPRSAGERGEFDPASAGADLSEADRTLRPHRPSPEVGGGVDRHCEERAKRRAGERAPVAPATPTISYPLSYIDHPHLSPIDHPPHPPEANHLS